MNWTSQPRQYAFLTAKEDVVLYGGARGGGKTDGELIWCIQACLRYDNAQIGLIRREFAELNKPKAAIPRSHDLLHDAQERGMCVWNEGDHEWRFRNGSLLQFGHLSDSKAIHKYLGAQYSGISIDQAEEIPFDWFNRLKGSLRSTGAAHHHRTWCLNEGCDLQEGELLHPVMRLTANPGGEGQSWIKSLFIDAAPPDTKYWVDSRGEEPVVSLKAIPHAQTFRFIPAKVWDNPALLALDPEYIDRLYSVGGQLARAWVNGDWTGFAGQFFTEWNVTRHVCSPFRIPDDWDKWHATDYGISKPSCTLWIARARRPGKTPDGKVIHTGQLVVYRERYETHRTVEQQALKISLWSGDESYRNQLLDPACWGLESNGMTIAEQYANHGVSMARANNNRKAGWSRVRELLTWCTDTEMRPCELCRLHGETCKLVYCTDPFDTHGVINSGCTHNTFDPGVIVMNHCVNLVRTLPNLIVDPKDPEDCDTHGDDHAPDAFRYGIMAQDVQVDLGERENGQAQFGAHRKGNDKDR